MTATTETDPSTLPQWKGKPIPWVTRWSDEQPHRDELAIQVGPSTDYTGLKFRWESNPDAELRDRAGFLWQREVPNRQGKGEPQFAHVATARQRRAMTRKLCQVCGTKLPEGKPINWLFGPGQLEHIAGSALTMSPPTCDGCVPVAQRLCPHLLRSGWTLAKVLEYRIWGVSGELAYLDPTDRRIKRQNNATVGYDNISPPLSPEAVLAKQQVVELVKFVIVEGGPT